ncbi:MAG: PD-(D/E)XK nuclease-like domain-containing protein [Streptococcaceae bacterium]|jgi:hypothetical protein|nr:PD-(D/E)XK nuclease-like domain-containing protein [Streptococcaceae bacterium]
MAIPKINGLNFKPFANKKIKEFAGVDGKYWRLTEEVVFPENTDFLEHFPYKLVKDNTYLKIIPYASNVGKDDTLDFEFLTESPIELFNEEKVKEILLYTPFVFPSVEFARDFANRHKGDKKINVKEYLSEDYKNDPEKLEILDKLSDPEFYYSKEANAEYLSTSELKGYLECEAMEVAYQKGEFDKFPKTTALVVGNAVHTAFESVEVHEKFMTEHKETFVKKGGELNDEGFKVGKIIDKLSKDQVFNDFYTGNKEVALIGEIGGVKFKGKVDNLDFERGFFTDIKTTADMRKAERNPETREYEKFYLNRGYHIQIAIYRLLLKQMFGMDFNHGIHAIDKTPSMEIQHFYIEENHLEKGLEIVIENIQRIILLRAGKVEPVRCGNCKYCRQTNKPFEFLSSDVIDQLIYKK